MDKGVNMERKIGFSWLLLPLSVLIFLSFALFIERSGITYTVSHKPSNFLVPLSPASISSSLNKDTTDADTLVLKYSDSLIKKASLDTITAVLDSMKTPYSTLDIGNAENIDLENYGTVVITFVELLKIDAYLPTMMDWVENGGKLLFAIRPDNSAALLKIAPHLGIKNLEEGYIQPVGVEFLSELLPGTAGVQFGLDYLNHSSLPVSLKDSSKLHLISADGNGEPILWETSYGKGKIVFINSDQFIDKSSRGLIGAAYSLLQDVIIYPVINASVFYIDDFPAPVPEGKDELIFNQFNRDIKSFYLNVWWPDMQEIKEKYNLALSSVIIETYDHILHPPFVYNVKQDKIFQYFGALVLRDGGEIGLHGYNHIPFCKEADQKNQVLGYPTWDTTADMQKSLQELQHFSTSMLPGQPFSVYVPVSNMLCDEARSWMPEVLPDLRIIASVYLPDANVPAYVQEFEEAEDGIIEFPRITAGYNPSNFMKWAAANEIMLHYTAGHFIHPDDVLDSYRSEGKTWVDLRETLDEYLLWLYSSMPDVRNLTSSEGAMAVQRFARLNPEYDCDNTGCSVSLDGFYDEGWMLMRTEKTPVSISAGAFSEVMNDLYLIEATVPNFDIQFEVQQ